MKTSLNFNPEYENKDNSRRLKGLLFVVALHLLLGWALISGMARQGIQLISEPLKAVVIQEVIIPPPPPPPPPPKEVVKPQTAPKVKAPPPPFVPPPEVTPTVAPPTAPVIESTPVAPPEPVVIAPPPPPAPAPVAAEPKVASIGVVCPTQVAPEMPRKAARSGITGVVKAEIHISNGNIRDVKILSGPAVFHDAVKKAIMKYECVTDGADVTATQEFSFELQ